MTLFKLSLKNIKKSFKNYMIYFFTIVLGVAIFYVFNAVSKQSVMFDLNEFDTIEIIEILDQTMSVVSIFVSVVLGFLIVYASTFLMKRRKNEFGVYMTLGMGKGKIAIILVMETIIIGLFSLAIGILIGIIASQGMSVVIINLFEADLTKFKFVFSGEAMLKTVLYFFIMFIVVLVLEVLIVSKTKLINLLNAAKKSEKETNKNPIVCGIVFVVAVTLLANAYYKVTVGFDMVRSFKSIGIEIIKGIIGTFLLFWSGSGFILLLARANKKAYYKRLKLFTTREISSRVNTTVFSGSIICLLLFFAMGILSTCFSVKKASDINMKKLVPFSIQMMYYSGNDMECPFEDADDFLEKLEIDTNKLKNIQSFTLYYRIPEVPVARVLKVSSYNMLADYYKYDKVDLAEDEIMFAGNEEQEIKDITENNLIMDSYTINGKEYKTKYKDIRYGATFMDSYPSQEVFMVVPDSFDISDSKYYYNFIMANYNTTNKKEISEYNSYFMDIYRGQNNFSGGFTTKTQLYNDSVGVAILLVFVGLYLGVIFIISSAALLSLKLLSEAVENKTKYSILRKIGVDNQMIDKSIFSQCTIYFGIPLLIAIIHSIFGIQTATKILSFYGKSGLVFSIIVTAIMIITIYGGYGMITFFTSRKMLSEKV